jgi:hypothetical protein
MPLGELSCQQSEKLAAAFGRVELSAVREAGCFATCIMAAYAFAGRFNCRGDMAG